jgi:hypothetical protein
MSGILRPARDLGIVSRDRVVYLAPLPAGPIMVLTGAAAEVWAAAQNCPQDEVAARLADSDAAALTPQYIATFLEVGVLVES